MSLRRLFRRFARTATVCCSDASYFGGRATAAHCLLRLGHNWGRLGALRNLRKSFQHCRKHPRHIYCGGRGDAQGADDNISQSEGHAQ
ncbi:hypothetical protein A2U01_0030108, partial [Trifolium medium]|nr:hypothetical protein [Trifolium medium]